MRNQEPIHSSDEQGGKFSATEKELGKGKVFFLKLLTCCSILIANGLFCHPH